MGSQAGWSVGRLGSTLRASGQLELGPSSYLASLSRVAVHNARNNVTFHLLSPTSLPVSGPDLLTNRRFGFAYAITTIGSMFSVSEPALLSGSALPPGESSKASRALVHPRLEM